MTEAYDWYGEYSSDAARMGELAAEDLWFGNGKPRSFASPLDVIEKRPAAEMRAREQSLSAFMDALLEKREFSIVKMRTTYPDQPHPLSIAAE